jgi:hypothetical protein
VTRARWLAAHPRRGPARCGDRARTAARRGRDADGAGASCSLILCTGRAIVSKSELTEHIYDQTDKDLNVIEVLGTGCAKFGADLSRRGAVGYMIGDDAA